VDGNAGEGLLVMLNNHALNTMKKHFVLFMRIFNRMTSGTPEHYKPRLELEKAEGEFVVTIRVEQERKILAIN
jgi:hypothetical protein